MLFRRNCREISRSSNLIVHFTFWTSLEISIIILKIAVFLAYGPGHMRFQRNNRLIDVTEFEVSLCQLLPLDKVFVLDVDHRGFLFLVLLDGANLNILMASLTSLK